jgi:hypothetical protein
LAPSFVITSFPKSMEICWSPNVRFYIFIPG